MKLRLAAIALGALTLMGAAIPAIAQTPSPSTSTPPMEHRRGGGMDALGLTTEQRDQMRAIAEESHQAIIAVLTDEQRAQLETMAQQRGPRPEPGAGGEWGSPPEGARPEHGPGREGMRNVFASLNLTEDQEASIREIRDNAHERMQAVLTDEQQQQLEQMRQNHPRPR